tara:strand:- start:1235 stop:1678 length:444 start_codon:yes stop_codon:yes gene_type:complete
MILNFLKKDKKNDFNDHNKELTKMIALLIHAARIDENYTEKEKKLIINFAEMSSKKNLSKNEILDLISKAEEYEKNSNQILEYTQEVKKLDLKSKQLVLEFLWKIILSDDKSDVYESTLMRRICGLLYLPDKLSGEIKSNILKRKKI